jgi:hypothetical protein
MLGFGAFSFKMTLEIFMALPPLGVSSSCLVSRKLGPPSLKANGEASARGYPSKVVVATILVGIPLNWLLGGTRSGLQRIAIALVSVPATVVLAVALFTFNALVPETYAALLRFADWIWQASLSALSSRGESIPGAIKLTNIARQGFSGHHYVIMALCSIVASFLVNALFAFATAPKRSN